MAWCGLVWRPNFLVLVPPISLSISNLSNLQNREKGPRCKRPLLSQPPKVKEEGKKGKTPVAMLCYATHVTFTKEKVARRTKNKSTLDNPIPTVLVSSHLILILFLPFPPPPITDYAHGGDIAECELDCEFPPPPLPNVGIGKMYLEFPIIP